MIYSLKYTLYRRLVCRKDTNLLTRTKLKCIPVVLLTQSLIAARVGGQAREGVLMPL